MPHYFRKPGAVSKLIQRPAVLPWQTPCFYGSVTATMNATALSAPPSARAWLLGTLLLILAAKFWLIASFSSPLPFLDQWRGEGEQMLRPWLRGELTAAHFFQPFNEHRIVPSRVLMLGLFTANSGEWDARTQMIAGAFLHAASAGVLGLVLVRLFGKQRLPVICGGLLLLFALPFGWQNTLWGFQSQFYFLLLFSLLTFWGLGMHAPFQPRWWIGVAAGLCAGATMASGGFVGLAILLAVGVRRLAARGRSHSSREWPTILAAAILAALGFALYAPSEAESLTAFRQPSLPEFINGFALRLSWPNVQSPLFALLAYAPFVALLAWHLRPGKRPPTLGQLQLRKIFSSRWVSGSSCKRRRSHGRAIIP